MYVSVADATAQLSDLVQRAEAGDDIVLTRQGHPAVRLVPITPIVRSARRPDIVAARRAVIEAVRASAVEATEGPCAARSQDFLYGDDGLPG